MKQKFVAILLILNAVSFNLTAQIKYERERRISEDNVPSAALSFVQACQFKTRVKWYLEENQDGWSIEAKLKYGGNRVSIEFDSLGQIQDVETEIKLANMNQNTWEIISNFLNAHYDRINIFKIQRQWTAEPQALIDLIRLGKTDKQYSTRYEIVARGRENRQKAQLFEFLFADDGTLINRFVIISRNIDNLDL
jgi:hypothetical protein